MKPQLAIGDRWLPPAVAGQPYRHELKLLHGQARPRWSLAEGKLPAGLSLAESGVIAGQSGKKRESIRWWFVSRPTTARPSGLRLEIAADKPPAVVTPALDKIGLDTYLLKELKAEGGVGHKSWWVAAGTFPHGLRLSPSGMLYGTPGEEGEFPFMVRVEDSHPAGSRGAQSQVKLHDRAGRPDDAAGQERAVEDHRIGRPAQRDVLDDGPARVCENRWHTGQEGHVWCGVGGAGADEGQSPEPVARGENT